MAAEAGTMGFPFVLGEVDEVDVLRCEIEHLRAAMEHRAAIEQAKGILMARLRCTPDEAFERLVQESQRTNRKLRDIAADEVAITVGRSLKRPITRS